MTVYILMTDVGDEYGSSIEGVYATKEIAEFSKSCYQKPWRNDMEVEEWEVAE